MIISRKFILTMVMLTLGSSQALAKSPHYVAKLTLPTTSKTIEVPIFSQFLQATKSLSAADTQHLLKFSMKDALASTNPLHYQQLGMQIAQVKHTLQGHVAVFDADLLSEGTDSTDKMQLTYEQLATVYADILNSLQKSKKLLKAFNVKLNSEEGAQALLDNYRQQLDAEPASSNVVLAARLMEARLDGFVRFEHETIRRELQQEFVPLNIAQQNADLGSYLALRFALLHHLYQQRIELRLPTVTSFQANNELQAELRFHQAREELSRTLYRLLQREAP